MLSGCKEPVSALKKNKNPTKQFKKLTTSPQKPKPSSLLNVFPLKWMNASITQWHSLLLNPSAPFVFPWTYFPYKNQFCLCCYVMAQTNVRKLTDRLYRQSREPDCVQGCQVHKVNKRIIDLCNFFSLISFNYNSYFRHYLWRKAQHNVSVF